MLDFNIPDFERELAKLYEAGDLAAVEDYLKKTLRYVESTMTVSGCSSCECHDEKALENSDYRREEIEWVVTRSKGIIAVSEELGALYRDTGRPAEALDCFLRAKDELREAGQERSEAAAMAALNVGTVQRMLNKGELALRDLGEAYRMLEALGGHEEAMANLWNNVGLVRLDRGEPTEAAASFERALSYGPTGEAAAAIWNNVALAAMARGDRTAAEGAVDKAMEVLEETGGPQLASAVNTKAVLRFYAADYAGALGFFERAAELTKALYGAGAQYASICRNCAAAAEKAGNAEKAALWRTKAAG